MLPAADCERPVPGDNASMLVLLVWLAFQSPAPASATVVTARDFRLELPPVIAGPLINILFENAGQEPHYLRFLRIGGRQTLEDVAAWRLAGGPLPAWLEAAGGVGTVAPGELVAFRAVMKPGRYVVLCGHPSPDGTPHADKGMYALVTVSGAGTEGDRLADATILLSDRGLQLFGEPVSGLYSLLASNLTRTSHQVLLVLLPDGVSEAGELQWFRDGSRGRRPGHPVGGAIELPGGQDARLRLHLRPGRYLAFCSVAADGRRHFDDGEIVRFEVR